MVIVGCFYLVFSVFDIQNKEDLFLKLVDRDGDSITNDDLPKLLRQFKSDSNFFVEMIFRSGVFTPQTTQAVFILNFLVFHKLTLISTSDITQILGKSWMHSSFHRV